MYYAQSLTLGLLFCLPLASSILNVHVIAHSHCGAASARPCPWLTCTDTSVDPGWLETTETYYMQSVHNILDNVLQQLQRNPDRRFNWSETVFFRIWCVSA